MITRLAPRLVTRLTPRRSRRPASYAPPAPAERPTRWGRLALLTLGVTALGLVAGAAFAAPDQVVPLARWGADRLADQAGPMIASASERLGAGARALEAGVSRLPAIAGSLRTPREIAMAMLGVLAALLAVGALVLNLRARSRATSNDGATVRSAPTGPAAARSAKATRGVPLIALTPPPAGSARRAFTRTTPTEVRTLVERGSSLTDIARRTGMPVDAVRTLLAVADPSGQLPVRTA